jgi:hypothetical protein
MIEQNAIIKSVRISNADHGCLTAWLHLEYDSSGQGFGGYMLYSPGNDDWAGKFIWRCMDVAGVSSWSEIPGKAVRVKIDGGIVRSIGHITKDIWFVPAKEALTR